MSLISVQEISLAFGGPLVFDRLSMQLEPGERVALLGRNGAGKTTLMKVIAQELPPDSGSVVVQKGAQVSRLPQEVPADISGNVFDVVLSGLGQRARLLSDYQHVSHQLHTAHTQELMRRLDALQAELDRTGAWDLNNQVETVISHMKLDPEADFDTLSGGQKRRALLGRALVLKPDVLLLDEPTNHLDIDSIDWLEGFLRDYPGTVCFVTHDRMFMSHVATRIMELDRGRMLSWACDYQTFLERRQRVQEVEDDQRRDFDKKLSEEEAWIRQGIPARRVRNEGRVKALERLRIEKRQQRKLEGKVSIQQQEADISGRLVVKVMKLGFSYGDRVIVRDLSTQIMRGDKIGLIGPNGSGKTTLLRLLLGKLTPERGKVRLGTNLQISYFDQMREQLDDEKTVMENVCSGSETVTINGKPRHLIGYLQEFLFSPDRAMTPVKVLSGGERNRLLLARLFTQPSNLLVMDEPTNDLDIETLELLEDLLVEYTGTLLLVSHDRSFLNNVVTSTIVLEGAGVVNEYPGGYDDWLAQRKPAAGGSWAKYKPPPQPRPPKQPSNRKLSFKDARELECLPAKIDALEREQDQLYKRIADVSLYQQAPQEAVAANRRMEEVKRELGGLYQRWEYLENLKYEMEG